MILDINESQEVCDWLIERGLGLGECANVLCDIGCGDTLGIALLKVFRQRDLKLEAANAKETVHDWGNPITP